MTSRDVRGLDALDDLDRKVLYHLDINSRQPVAALARKVGTNKDTVNYRIHRLLQRKIITRFSANVDTARLGYQNIKTYLQFQDFDEEKEQEFFSLLRSTPRIGWIVRCTGRWDALFCYWARSSFEFHQTLLRLLNAFSRYVYHKEIVHNINWFYYNRKWLLPAASHIYPVRYGEQPGMVKINSLDSRILQELIREAKAPLVAIAERSRTTPQTLMYRIRELQKKGVLTKFGIDINYENLGLIFVKVLIYLENMTLPRLQDLYSYCARQPNVSALTTTLGAWDLELEFEVRSVEEVLQIMNRLKLQFRDILRSYETIVVTKQTEVIYTGE